MPAHLGARVGAWAIDLLITVPVPIALYVAVGVLVFDDDVPLAVALVLVAAVLAFHLLYAPLLQARSGARGKRSGSDSSASGW